MLLARTFSLYRREKTGKTWDYKSTPKYTADCTIQPVNLDVEVGLDNAPALDAWRLYTNTLDIEKGDKVVIDTVEYVVTGTKKYQ